MEYLGNATIQFHHHPNSLPLETKPGSDDESTSETTDLATVIKACTPPCRLNPLLFNGHVQTMWTVAKPHGPQIRYLRKVFEADHCTYRGSFAVDFVIPGSTKHKPEVPPEEDESLPPRTTYVPDEDFDTWGDAECERPMLIVLHGLSGGSHEVYLRYAIEPLVDSGDWEICVVNSRGCAGSAITSGVLYNARATWDVRQMIKWCQNKFPKRPLFAMGFSLGANILTNVSPVLLPVVLQESKGHHSMLVRRARTACSRPQYPARTRSTWKLPVKPCRVPFWENKSTSAPWGVSLASSCS